MFRAAFVSALRQFAPFYLFACIDLNALFFFEQREIVLQWWFIPMQIVVFLGIVLLVTPIEYDGTDSCRE